MTTYVINNSAGRDNACAAITELDPAKTWTVTIEPYRKRRTLSQLRTMWMWVDEVAEEIAPVTGYTKEELHEVFKHNFLPATILQVEGLEPTERRTTTNLDTAAMSAYMEEIFRWATQTMGIKVTLPPVQTEQRG